MRVFFVFCMLWSSYTILSCGSDPQTSTKEITEIYDFKLVNNEPKVGALTYKDIKYYNIDGQLIKQEFYNRDNVMKGYEVITMSSESDGVSNYYAPDSTLLSYYKLTFVDGKMIARAGFDGTSNEMLRTEAYSYNDDGLRDTKRILDVAGRAQRIFSFAYDENGNEKSFEGRNGDDQVFVSEEYKITVLDDQKRWIERAGYINGELKSFHKRSFE